MQSRKRGGGLTEVLILLQAFGKKQADGETDKMIEKWEVICSRAAGLVLPSIPGRGGGGIERSGRGYPCLPGARGEWRGGERSPHGPHSHASSGPELPGADMPAFPARTKNSTCDRAVIINQAKSINI